MNPYLSISPEVQQALDEGRPVVALESTIILRMFSLKMHNLSSLKQNWAQYLQVVATVAFVLLMGLPGLAAAISLYVLLSIIKREK